MEHDLNIRMIFGIKKKSNILTHRMAIATNIPQRLKTGFVALPQITHFRPHIHLVYCRYIFINYFNDLCVTFIDAHFPFRSWFVTHNWKTLNANRLCLLILTK